MKLSKLNPKKINFNDVDKNYSGQDILMKLGELYQFESGIFGYGNIWTKIERIVENIVWHLYREKTELEEETKWQEFNLSKRKAKEAL